MTETPQGKPLIASEVQGKLLLKTVEFAVDYYGDPNNPEVTGNAQTDELQRTAHLQTETLTHLEKMLFTEMVDDRKKREIFMQDAELYLNGSVGQKEFLEPILLLVMYEAVKDDPAQREPIEEKLSTLKINPATTDVETYTVAQMDKVYKALMDRVEGRVDRKDYEGESLLEPVVQETRAKVESTGMVLDAATKRRLGYSQVNPADMAGQGKYARPIMPRGMSARRRSPGQSG